MENEITGINLTIARQKNDIAKYISEIEGERQEKITAVSKMEAAQASEQRAISDAVTSEVIKYVQSDNTGICNLPGEWVLSHDRAASMSMSENTESSSSSNGESAGAITDREALVVVTNNYSRCRDNSVRQQALIDWVEAISQ
jgi:hypothetical protein